MTFHLRIEIGNAELSEAEHLADALRRVADAIERDGGYCGELLPGEHSIRDLNGNTVGTHKLVAS